MHLLDSSAWLECLESGPNTREFGPILRQLPALLIPSVVLMEVRKVVLHQRSKEAAEAISNSMRTGIVVPLDAPLASFAADLAIKHKLPLADAIIYATTLARKATLWTQDEHFKGLPNVRFFPKIRLT